MDATQIFSRRITFFLVIGGCILVFPIIWLDTEIEKAFIIALKYLFLPLLLLFVIWTQIDFKKRLSEFTKIRFAKIQALIIVPLLGASIIPVLCGSLLLYVNMFVGKQKIVNVKGEIIRRELNLNGSAFPLKSILLKTTDGNVLKLFISDEEFKQLNNGDMFSKEMKQGSLGILYKRRF